jgi:hypothetical protein
VDKWIEETISGSKKIEDRKLGKLLKKMRNDERGGLSQLIFLFHSASK